MPPLPSHQPDGLLVIDDVLTYAECHSLSTKHTAPHTLNDGGLAAEIYSRLKDLPPSMGDGCWSPAAGVWEQLCLLTMDAAADHPSGECEVVGRSSVLPLCKSFHSLLIFLEDAIKESDDALRFEMPIWRDNSKGILHGECAVR